MNSKMLAALTSISVVAICTTLVTFVEAETQPEVQAEHVPSSALPIVLEQPIELDLKSDPVEWQDRTYHLLSFREARFVLDDTQLTATLTGKWVSFDNVDYTIHAAVFDKDGYLLGTASAPFYVTRYWCPFLLHTQTELELDFGQSHAYTNATRVTFAISSRDVLAPTQWFAD